MQSPEKRIFVRAPATATARPNAPSLTTRPRRRGFRLADQNNQNLLRLRFASSAVLSRLLSLRGIAKKEQRLCRQTRNFACIVTRNFESNRARRLTANKGNKSTSRHSPPADCWPALLSIKRPSGAAHSICKGRSMTHCREAPSLNSLSALAFSAENRHFQFLS